MGAKTANTIFKCNIHRSVHRWYILRVQPTRCDVSQFIYFRKTLYMFQAVFPPIIWSSKLHIQSWVFVRPIPLPVVSLARLAACKSLVVRIWILYVQLCTSHFKRRLPQFTTRTYQYYKQPSQPFFIHKVIAWPSLTPSLSLKLLGIAFFILCSVLLISLTL